MGRQSSWKLLCWALGLFAPPEGAALPWERCRARLASVTGCDTPGPGPARGQLRQERVITGCWQQNRREGARKQGPADLGLLGVLGTELTFGKAALSEDDRYFLHKVIIISQTLLNGGASESDSRQQHGPSTAVSAFSQGLPGHEGTLGELLSLLWQPVPQEGVPWLRPV